jgi:hypothetical protein
MPFPSPARLSRRDLLARSGMGLGALGLAGVCADELPAVAAGGPGGGPHFAPRAKRVIHFF